VKPLALALADWVAQLSFEQIPAEVISSAKDRVQDILGISIAATQQDAGLAVRGLRDEWGSSPTHQASFVAETGKGTAATAAMVNGTYAHSLDFDDTHLPSVVHPSAPMVPAVLAQAQASGAGGREFLTALVAAYEVNVRLSMAQFDPKIGNSSFFENGLHATSIIGAVAAGAACARLRGLDEAGIMNSIAVACSMGAGLLEANRAGGSIKKFHGGWAAHSAVVAAGMAYHGLTGPPTVLEGRFGFFRAFCGEHWRPEAVTDGLGERWETPKILYKPYPCNHFTHAVVDAALALKEKGLEAKEIDWVTIGTAGASWRTIGDPIEEKRHPRTPYQATFSAPFVFATALVGGSGLGVTTRDFTEEKLAEPVRVRVAERTDVVVDDECTRLFPYQFPAVVKVRTRDGGLVEQRISTNRGSLQRPLGATDMHAKLVDNTGELADGIAAACRGLDSAPDLEGLFSSTVTKTATRRT
jgi:2-methylcitrate dehydratase PrpD